MAYTQIASETQGDVALLTLNRPEKLNAWTRQMSVELVDAITAANDDAQIGAIVVTGAGRGFCAGADIGSQFKAQLDGERPQPSREGGDRTATDWVPFCRAAKPLVAAINGAAIGVGLTMVLPFDQLVAAADAKLSCRFIKMGLAPELASSHFLVQRCGWGMASDLALSGRMISGTEAAAIGLVDRAVPAGEVLEVAMGLAREYAANPDPQLRMIKQLLTENGSETDLGLVQQRELAALNAAFKTPEHREAVDAFLEKRAQVPLTMLAVTIVDGRLELAEVMEPEPRPHEITISVRAAGLNRADLAVRRGTYRTNAPPPPGPQIAGGECAGEVIAAGADADGNRQQAGLAPLRLGDRAMAMARGSYAQQVTVDARMATPVPLSWSWEEAGAAPVTFVTAHDAIVTAGGHTAGGSVLVNAASSGVGVAALQIAGLRRARPLIAVSRSQAKLDRLAEAGIGFDAGLTVADPDEIARLTADRGVDVIIDSVGAGTVAANVAAAALGGRIVSVGRLAGVRDEIDLDELARKRVSLVGVTFRTRAAEQARAVVMACWRDLGPALADGSIRPLVDRTFPLEAAAEAQDRLAENAHVGKIVLQVAP